MENKNLNEESWLGRKAKNAALDVASTVTSNATVAGRYKRKEQAEKFIYHFKEYLGATNQVANYQSLKDWAGTLTDPVAVSTELLNRALKDAGMPEVITPIKPEDGKVATPAGGFELEDEEETTTQTDDAVDPDAADLKSLMSNPGQAPGQSSPEDDEFEEIDKEKVKEAYDPDTTGGIASDLKSRNLGFTGEQIRTIMYSLASAMVMSNPADSDSQDKAQAEFDNNDVSSRVKAQISKLRDPRELRLLIKLLKGEQNVNK